MSGDFGFIKALLSVCMRLLRWTRAPSRGQLPIIRELLDVMHYAVQLPLALHFVFAAQTKPLESFVRANIGKDGFDN